MNFNFDVIVVGAGHAGCEAARAAALTGCSTLLITMDLNKIAQMSCNPAIGGIAKGQIVREIDALGGAMGFITDAASIQFRMLNRSKGPAMWSPRAQADRMKFSQLWRRELETTPDLYMWQDSATELLIEGDKVCGVRTAWGVSFTAKAVVLTNGTFLNGLMHVGRSQIRGGRVSEPFATGLTEQLVSLGFQADRMKTGTPVRLDARTIDFSLCTRQDGDDAADKFSYLPESRRTLKQLPCWTTKTNPETHAILREGLPDSPLYNGQIKSIGPRYCPSIETKIVTFADKDEHHLFLEPEGENTTEYYLNGFSSSLPFNVQMRALRTIPALRNVQILRPGYAIEYDFFPPTQLYHTLETRLIHGLYFAGQINGTTGYEEAAGQGLIAGLNASAAVRGVDPFTPARDQAYIGVLIDDLVTKGVDEPYRMFTSRAEYRILLRQDDADSRLTPDGYRMGLATDHRLNTLREKEAQIQALTDELRAASLKVDQINPLLAEIRSAPVSQTVRAADVILRPGMDMSLLSRLLPGICNYSDEVRQAVEIRLKYAGYIDRERQLAEKMTKIDHITLGDKLDYSAITALSTEARQKLTAMKPETVGRASRIPGVSPADINVLLLMLGK
ncbi:MAG: tRNA uridine-5-carboxymethylaminomethyl(34) synthesis enzyme MnmG [Bacteroides sp.]|nr:tRNA uridine-5-carboxymethylaminomethyl(34) synthesis enzyme MnmG [Bacteroides sp.]MCM1379604.1 tRNA uridine-5-carboxymethylaminomethyl(34) synthesis enzyme MnmG [Bacteroides sp.]MCM1446014.1 tRNA uridine-5-carboxymethylaminomethyl(34) synthesis enzyme MnmG [Prevotella sp.]